MKYKLQQLYREVYSTFFPQHKSLRRAIPRKWMDLDGIVDDFLDAVIVSFVEEENGLDQIQLIEDSERQSIEEITNNWGSVSLYNDYRNDHLANYKKLSEIYTWIKIGRKIQQKIVDELYAENYIVAANLEKELYDKNTEYYGELVRLRGYLWT